MRIFHLDKEKPWKDQDLGGRRLGRSVCVQRYGGFGDMLQMSSVLPGLKEQGYSVTINTTDDAFDIVRNDPHIDAVFLQELEQVPNQELGYYWTKLASNFDRFVMLSESVEGALIAMPGWKQFGWQQDFRRMIMGTVDYLEATHAIAEVPLPPKVMFYPTKNEEKAAQRYRAKLGIKSKVILWALAGSSPHKAWPYIDNAVARILIEYPEAKVVMCGDGLCQVLEHGWGREKRVIRKSGKWSIRETLAFAQQADLIIGPETGILNSVSMLDMPKILMLSHSSRTNIGSNWINAKILVPENVDCYPCHQLHQSFEYCHRDEDTGGALCAAGMPLEKVYGEIIRALSARGIQ